MKTWFPWLVLAVVQCLALAAKLNETIHWPWVVVLIPLWLLLAAFGVAYWATRISSDI